MLSEVVDTLVNEVNELPTTVGQTELFVQREVLVKLRFPSRHVIVLRITS